MPLENKAGTIVACLADRSVLLETLALIQAMDVSWPGLPLVVFTLDRTAHCALRKLEIESGRVRIVDAGNEVGQGYPQAVGRITSLTGACLDFLLAGNPELEQLVCVQPTTWPLGLLGPGPRRTPIEVAATLDGRPSPALVRVAGGPEGRAALARWMDLAAAAAAGRPEAFLAGLPEVMDGASLSSLPEVLDPDCPQAAQTRPNALGHVRAAGTDPAVYHLRACGFVDPYWGLPCRDPGAGLPMPLVRAVYVPWYRAMLRGSESLHDLTTNFRSRDEHPAAVGREHMILAPARAPRLGVPGDPVVLGDDVVCYTGEQAGDGFREAAVGPRGVAAVRAGGAALEDVARAAAEGRVEDALEAADDLLSHEPGSPAVVRLLGRLARQDDLPPPRLVSRVLHDAAAVEAMAQGLAERGASAALETLVREHLDRYPDDVSVARVLMEDTDRRMDELAAACRMEAGNWEDRDYDLSVMVSTYASEEFMRECLGDLAAQTAAGRFEVLVVDADSPEDEESVVAEFQARHDYIRYCRVPERISVYGAWNLAIRLARGGCLTPFSTNDRLDPDAYRLMLAEMDADPDLALVFGDSWLTARPHQPMGEPEFPSRYGPCWRWPDYTLEWNLTNPTVGPHPVWRTGLHRQVGYFDERYPRVGDQDFFLKVGRAHKVRHIPVFTGMAWLDPESVSGAAPAVAEFNRIRDVHAAVVNGSVMEQAAVASLLEQVDSLLGAGRVEAAGRLYASRRRRLPPLEILATLDRFFGARGGRS